MGGIERGRREEEGQREQSMSGTAVVQQSEGNGRVEREKEKGSERVSEQARARRVVRGREGGTRVSCQKVD